MEAGHTGRPQLGTACLHGAGQVARLAIVSGDLGHGVLLVDGVEVVFVLGKGDWRSFGHPASNPGSAADRDPAAGKMVRDSRGSVNQAGAKRDLASSHPIE